MANDNKGKNKNPWANKPKSKPERRDNDDNASHSKPHYKRSGGGFSGGGNGPDLGDMIPKDLNAGVIGLAILGALVFLTIYLSAFIVKPGEQAVVQQFGAWNRTISQEGLSFKFPWPIEKVTTVNVNEIRKMNVGFAEIGNRNSNSIRDIPEESLMLTSDRNIVDLDMVIQWNIKSAEHFLFNINDQINTIKKVAESAVREQVGQTNMFPIITTDRDEVAQQTKQIIQNNLDEYNSGVNITQVLIQRAEVHPDVQQAFQDVQSAKQDGEDVQNRARAYREDIIPKARGEAIKRVQEAEGYKESTVAKANGDADRFNSIYQSYLSGQDVTKKRIYLETMEDVLGNAQKIIIDQDGGSGVVPYLPLNDIRNQTNNKTSN